MNDHNLRSVHGCHDCQHVFERRDYDEGDTYFCDLDKTRPTCPSTLLGEYLTGGQEVSLHESHTLWRAAEDAWNEWVGFGSRGHRREGWQICDEWKEDKSC